MTSLCPRAAVVFVVPLVGVVPTATTARAQSTPAAAYTITKLPELTRQVWPADFNRDGRTDLIGAAGSPRPSFPPTDLLLSLGRADRTFPAPQSLGIAAEPYHVSDINADGAQDVVIRTTNSLAVLPGRGDGTFDAPRTVATFTTEPPERQPLFVLVADFTGDGHRDIGFSRSEPGTAFFRVLPGRGDLTFDAPHDTPLPFSGARSGVTGDFNGDGRTDAALAARCCDITLLINNAGVAFAVSDLGVNADIADVATGDLDRDGDLDLVATDFYDRQTTPETGRVFVLLGNGSGAFGAPALYDTGLGGELTVVVGDFTGDGILDVATGNLSALRDEDQGAVLGDSISVLVGNGTGGLGAPVTFRLGGDQPEDASYRHTHDQLNTNDINRDGITDLIASPGAVLLSRPLTPNRPPEVSAGPDQILVFEDLIILDGHASDPDGHWLEYRWTDAVGNLIHNVPRVLLYRTPLPPGTHTFTLTVRDAFGGEASDALTVRVEPTEQRPLPEGWRANDVGAVAESGRTIDAATGAFGLIASGADIWGTRDEFHFGSREWSHGEATEITVRVSFVENVHPWTKAGIMVRNHLGANAAHASLFVTPTTVKGVAFQRRRSDGAVSVHTSGPALVAPIWLKLIVRGPVVRAYYRTDEGTWTFVGQDTIAFGGAEPGAIGLALTSHVDGVYASASFGNVSVRPLENWIEEDIGRTNAPGTGSSNDVRVTLAGAGADIWGTADAFRYRYRTGGTSPTVVTARVLSVENTHAWAKAGVMIRETRSPGARHVMLIASPGKGVAMQYRPEPNRATLNTAIVAGAAPKWLRLIRFGRDFVGQMSDDGISWVHVGRATLPVDGPLLEGIAVTSHTTSTGLATAVFEDVSAEPRMP